MICSLRYKRAAEKLRILAETCERVKVFWFDTEPFLKAVYGQRRSSSVARRLAGSRR